MNDLISAVILGFVQGVTELLPVSSSGHLIIVRDVLGISLVDSLLFDVVLHLATALAIIVYFWSDIVEMFKNPKEKMVMWIAIILGTIPAVIFGLLFNDSIRNTNVVVISLILGSILFFVAEYFAKEDKILSVKSGVGIGFFQALALIPGVSRSGATISGGLLFGMKREEAAKFSFMLGIPVILGAGFLEVIKSFDILAGGSLDLPLIVGAVVSFVTAFFVIKYLLEYLRNHTLVVFGWYRIALAILVLILL
ncbi:MAG: undecaprenyl-diphosphatase UppP [Candidatus Pacebacteria bacterium]|nr:undecaprenyl-diphosphatase UppP [Candidatus Paceibacterota bacterium]